VIADGVHGLLVPPRDPVAIANAVERLDRDRGLLSRMAEEGRRHVLQHYTVSRLGSEFDQLYGPLR
jgi:glycosyltransferase involved in cell wall biosynthesis